MTVVSIAVHMNPLAVAGEKEEYISSFFSSF